MAKARSRTASGRWPSGRTRSKASCGSWLTRRSSSRSRTWSAGVGVGEPGPLIKELLSSYRQTSGGTTIPLEEYRYVHAAYKMVGVGSVGTRCYIVLLLGRDHDDPLFLQVKEAQASVLERFLARQHLRPPRGARGRRAAADAGRN